MKNRLPLINITAGKIRQDVRTFEPDARYSYLKSYPHFINYFQAIRELEPEHLIIGSHMVYGWMPRVLSFKGYDDEKVLSLCNHVKRKGDALLKEEELKYLKSAINNSMVGLSKLLHFINPQQYAIWDSHIFRYATGISKNPGTGVGRVDLYLDYLQQLEIVTRDELYHEIETVVTKKLKLERDSLYPYRVIELVIFETQRNKKYKV